MKAAYNVVTDTVTGVNVRWSDNKFQAILVFAAVLLAAAIGAILAWLNPRWDLPWYGGALVGALLREERNHIESSSAPHLPHPLV